MNAGARRGVYLACTATVITLLVGCRPPPGGRTTDKPTHMAVPAPYNATPAAPPSDYQAPFFNELARESGLDFVHENGMTGELYFVEMVGSGAALFDMDNDGDLDLFVVQGHPLGEDDLGTGPRPLDRLYRNDLTTGPDGRAQARFTDVTAQSGIVSDGYGMGVAIADVDGDGLLDIYVTNWGPNSLWRNLGDGKFEDWSARSGVTGGDAWSTSATFLDYDGDGLLDLFVTNYARFSYADHHACFNRRSGAPDYCGPSAYPAVMDTLYRNQGDGRFRDVTEPAGIASRSLPGLGVVAADFDGDGLTDLYVANDGTANVLWRNLGNGGFQDVAVRTGSAFNAMGAPEAGMGVAAVDFDHDGDLDLFLTHLTGESNTLYENTNGGLFRDRTHVSGLGVPSLPATGFGIGLIDIDLDGWLDLYVANGAVSLSNSDDDTRSHADLGQPDQVFRNRGDGTFDDVSSLAGPAVSAITIGRGVAAGDIDNDGDVDLVVVDNNAPIRLLVNQSDHGIGWIGFDLEGKTSSTELDARLMATLKDGRVLWRRAHRDGSYCSSSDQRVVFGLGSDGALDSIAVHWNGGSIEHWRDLEPGRYHVLSEGTGLGGAP
jgi:enediyne biosynthesis protein E4